MAERDGKGQQFWSNTFEVIEKVWAEDGVIRVQLKQKRSADIPDVGKEGFIRTLQIHEAKARVHELQTMLNMAHKQSHIKEKVKDIFVIRRQFEPVIKAFSGAILEAQRQREAPKDLIQARMSNFFQGLDKDGNPIKKDFSDEDTVVFEWLTMYPTIEEHEARLIYRNKTQAAVLKQQYPFLKDKDDQEVKEIVIKKMDEERFNERYGHLLKRKG
jgi:hypothetical protein